MSALGLDQKFVRKAIEAAYESDSYHSHGAVLVSGGKQIAQRCNTSHRSIIRGRFMPSIHAEMAVLSYGLRGKAISEKCRGLKRNRVRRADVYVVHVTSTNRLANSRPCADCLHAMKAVGIRRVFYSNANGEIVMEKIRDMASDYLSEFQRQYVKPLGKVVKF